MTPCLPSGSMFTLSLSEQDSVGSSKGVCVMLCCAAHSEEVWLQVNCTDFRWIRTTSFLVVLNFFSVDFFIKISKSLLNKRCLLYYALTLVGVFQCFPETPYIVCAYCWQSMYGTCYNQLHQCLLKMLSSQQDGLLSV